MQVVWKQGKDIQEAEPVFRLKEASIYRYQIIKYKTKDYIKVATIKNCTTTNLNQSRQPTHTHHQNPQAISHQVHLHLPTGNLSKTSKASQSSNSETPT